MRAEKRLTYAGHKDGLLEARWSPDGKRIASGDMSGSVHVWDPATGAQLYTFQMPNAVTNIDWSPDGRYLVATGWFDTPQVVRVWFSTEELIEHAHQCCVKRELTAEERVQLGLPPAEEDR